MGKFSGLVRVKSKYRRKKESAKRIHFAARMREAKEKKLVERMKENRNPCEGRRIVELIELGKNLICRICERTLSLSDTVDENCEGLHSILQVWCQSCCVSTSVHTGKTHENKIGRSVLSDTNSKLLLGQIHSRQGHAALNKVLACLNIPTISTTLYKRYEREVGESIERAAKESCIEAAEEERSLVLENLDKLCEQLPEEIVSSLYDELKALRSSHFSQHSESIPSDTMESESSAFDYAIGRVINIIVSYDMGWSKRGNGRSYDSLNGYGAIIGFLSGKILDYGTRNRKCKSCMMGKETKHDCRLNYHGSAKGMEADLAAQLINGSEILKEAKLQVRAMGGDDDSSSISKVREGSSVEIFKLSDANHLKKNFGKELYNLKPKFKELRKDGVIKHLQKCFSYAISQNSGNSSAIAASIISIPNHIFGNHDKCGDWCHTLERGNRQTIKLSDQHLFHALTTVFVKYAGNSQKLACLVSSQANECLNSIQSRKCNKAHVYSLSSSADFRFASSVNVKNNGNRYIPRVLHGLNLSPGKHTKRHNRSEDIKRQRKAQMSKTLKQKSRRVFLSKKRILLRRTVEQSEGIQYQSNMGLDLEIDQNLLRSSVAISSDTCEIVIFDLETSGFGGDAEILQIAAKTYIESFSIYVNPTKPISPFVTRVNNLSSCNGELLYQNVRVDSVPIAIALQKFNQFLNSCSGKPALLVAHNARFDTRFLLKAIHVNGLSQSFQAAIIGFCDTLPVLKKAFPDRTGTGAMKLENLAKDLLKNEDFSGKGCVHEASYDVQILEKIMQLVSSENIFNNAISYVQAIYRENSSIESANIQITLTPLKGEISNGMINKMAKANISYSNLQDIFVEKGAKGLEMWLSEEVNEKKPRLTRAKKILHNISAHFLKK